MGIVTTDLVLLVILVETTVVVTLLPISIPMDERKLVSGWVSTDTVVQLDRKCLYIHLVYEKRLIECQSRGYQMLLTTLLIPALLLACSLRFHSN